MLLSVGDASNCLDGSRADKSSVLRYFPAVPNGTQQVPPRPRRRGSYQVVRNRSRGLDRVATSAGATAMRLATTRTPATRRADEPHRHDRNRHGAQIVGEGTPYGPADHDPQWDTDHNARRRPTSWPARPRSRRPGRSRTPPPSADPTSRRRRDTLTTSRWSSVAAPNTAKMAPKMSGKLTASPKLMSEVGVTARAVSDRYAIEVVVDGCLSSWTRHDTGQHPAVGRLHHRVVDRRLAEDPGGTRRLRSQPA